MELLHGEERALDRESMLFLNLNDVTVTWHKRFTMTNSSMTKQFSLIADDNIKILELLHLTWVKIG